MRRDRIVHALTDSGRAMLVAAVGVAVLSGCFAELPPDLVDPAQPTRKVVEVFRVPTPIDPGADARWQAVVPELGVLGEGRRLVRIDPDGNVLWSQELPEEFAITAPTGAPHSMVPLDHATLMLLAGSPKVAGPAAVRLINPITGEILAQWRLPPAPPGEASNQLIFAGGMASVWVAAHCTATRCELTGMDWLGTRLWTARMNERVRLENGVDSPGGGRSAAVTRSRLSGPSPCPCLYAVGKARLYQLNPETGKRFMAARLDSARVGHVIATPHRSIVVSIPHGRACTATATAFDDDAQLRRVWSLRFRWDQPTVARRPDGCRYDPALPLMFGPYLVIPDADGALVVDTITGRASQRLDRGELIEGNGALTWTPGIGYRRDRWYSQSRPVVIQAVRERSSVLTVASGGLLFGSDGGRGPLTLVRFSGEVAWRDASAGPAFVMASDRVVYADDTGHLVGLGPDTVDGRR